MESNQNFKTIESYKHKLAKEVLKEWLNDDYLRVDIESKFSMNGLIRFVPDVACYDENGLSVIYEVVYTNSVSSMKLWKMKWYFHIHKWEDVKVYEINADWILNQVNKPQLLNQKQII